VGLLPRYPQHDRQTSILGRPTYIIYGDQDNVSLSLSAVHNMANGLVIGLGIWLVQFLQVQVLVLLQQYQKSIGIGIANTF